jgi:four helix bundle protein
MDNANQIKQKIRICIGESNEVDYWLNLGQELDIMEESTKSKYRERNQAIRKMLYRLFKSIGEV